LFVSFLIFGTARLLDREAGGLWPVHCSAVPWAGPGPRLPHTESACRPGPVPGAADLGWCDLHGGWPVVAISVVLNVSRQIAGW